MRVIDPIEQSLLLEGIFQKYGYDFRKYSTASLTRRLQQALLKSGFEDPLDFLKKILRDESFFRFVLPNLTVGTTELFRDPEVFRMIREQLVPVLKTYPRVQIWVAGCSTGEEVYSLSILLQEEGLSHRCLIYATDINPEFLQKARAGTYSLSTIQHFVRNYTLAGGLRSPSEYYSVESHEAVMDPSLRSNVIFDEHNLATDQVFGEMHLILCRNVLIYFNKSLQDRVFKLFYDSLIYRGFLILGTKETTKFSNWQNLYRPVDLTNRLYQKYEQGADRALEV